jgi:hypothetical protein
MATQFEKVMEFEAGKLNDEATIGMFDELIKSGDIWKLPNKYQDMAATLIERGVFNNNQSERSKLN